MPSSHLFLSNEETRESFPRDRREHSEVGGMVWGVVERRDCTSAAFGVMHPDRP